VWSLKHTYYNEHKLLTQTCLKVWSKFQVFIRDHTISISVVYKVHVKALDNTCTCTWMYYCSIPRISSNKKYQMTHTEI
jgi:hypothetical protein